MTDSYTITRRHIPERVIAGKRLGRHVNHDSRSLAYLVEPVRNVVSARWTRETPVLDQGNLGSCTGNACCGALGTDPLYGPVRAAKPDLVLNETEAVTLYSAATHLDNVTGAYPPDDTGSSGLAVAQAAKNYGLISGYQHITSVAAAQAAIQTGPFIVGTDWYSSMDDPDSRGLVTVGGTVRGGHEYECIGYDATNDVWEFVNSWGTSWGKAGHFFYTSASFARLLADQGDATVLVPLTQPAPTPTPAPPSNTITKTLTVADAATIDDWASAPHIWRKATAAAKAWKRAT